MRLAALLAKGSASDASVLPAMQVLECATLGAARALGLDGRIGTIEVGKDADVVAIDLSSPETSPVFEPVSHLVYACGRENVSDVWVAGKPVVRMRQPTQRGGGLQEPEISALIRAWQNRIQSFLGRSQ